MDAAARKQIVRLHNQMRSKVASGRMAGFESADRMVEMVRVPIRSAHRIPKRFFFRLNNSFP